MTKEIIDTFKIEKNQFIYLKKIKIKGNKDYKKILKFYGIVEVTDWFILVNTTPGKLVRRLKERGYSEFEQQK